MSDESVNMWEFSSGLPLEGQRCHSTKAVFTYDQEYNADAVVLKVTFQPWDGETDEGEAKDQLFSVGKNWEPTNEGQSVANKSGKRQQFNNMTVISRFLNSIMLARGDGDVAKGMKVLMEEGAEPDNADFYVGMDVTLKSIEYKDLSGKDKTTFGVGEWHGRVGETAKAKPAKALAPKTGTAKAAAKPAPKEDEDEGSTESGGEGAWIAHFGQGLYRKLKKAAMDAESHDAFMDAAFDIDGVTSDDKAWNKVAEQYIMEYEDGSLFATARA